MGNQQTGNSGIFSNLSFMMPSNSKSAKVNQTESASIIDAAAIIEMLPKKKGRRPNYIKELIE
jgi:hypothetical protein